MGIFQFIRVFHVCGVSSLSVKSYRYDSPLYWVLKNTYLVEKIEFCWSSLDHNTRCPFEVHSNGILPN